MSVLLLMSGKNGLVLNRNSKGKEGKKGRGKGGQHCGTTQNWSAQPKSTEAQNHRRPWKIELLCHKSGNAMQGATF